MRYRYQTTERFWKNFYALPDSQKESVREKWRVFKVNPFEPSLGTHQIHRLSARAGHTIYSVLIEEDLRVLFRIDGNVITSLTVGTHDIYQ